MTRSRSGPSLSHRVQSRNEPFDEDQKDGFDPMKATWASIRAICQVLSFLAAVAALVLVVPSFSTGDLEWTMRAVFLMCVFSLPALDEDVIRRVWSL